jgi:glycosyltransferase involved in cell wall biosynthesis
VVAHKAHALAEVVGDAGLLVNATDEDQLAAGIGRVLEDPSLAAQLRTRGLARAARFSWDRAADELQNIFDSIWT